MNIKTFVIGLVLIGAVMLGCFNFMTKLSEPQHFNNERIQSVKTLNSEYQSFNKINQIQDDFNKSKTGIEQILGKDEEGNTDFPTYQTGLWQQIKNTIYGTSKVASGTVGGIAGVFGLSFDIVEDLGNNIKGIPTWFITTILTILTVFVVTIFYKFAFGREI